MRSPQQSTSQATISRVLQSKVSTVLARRALDMDTRWTKMDPARSPDAATFARAGSGRHSWCTSKASTSANAELPKTRISAPTVTRSAWLVLFWTTTSARFTTRRRGHICGNALNQTAARCTKPRVPLPATTCRAILAKRHLHALPMVDCVWFVVKTAKAKRRLATCTITQYAVAPSTPSMLVWRSTRSSITKNKQKSQKNKKIKTSKNKKPKKSKHFFY